MNKDVNKLVAGYNCVYIIATTRIDASGSVEKKEYYLLVFIELITGPK